MQHTDIDPALGLMAEFGKVTKGTVRHINLMRQDAIFADGAVPARYKALAATLWAVSAFYVQEAVRLGADQAELGEFLAVASTMGGCVGEMWALKAFKAYKDLANGEPATSTATRLLFLALGTLQSCAHSIFLNERSSQ